MRGPEPFGSSLPMLLKLLKTGTDPFDKAGAKGNGGSHER